MSRRSDAVVWDQSAITREARWRALGSRGATVWFTGLPGSGKSSLAAAVEAQFVGAGRSAYRLDGDNLRHGINGDLGFDRGSRDENVRRAAEVARLMADAGTIAIVSLISPYARARARARELHEGDGLPFVEVWVATPVEECERRDRKGLYARARRGELTGVTGINDPYEPPVGAEIVVRPEDDQSSVVARVLAVLGARDVVSHE
jgi:adenylyl-sulfate kinase